MTLALGTVPANTTIYIPFASYGKTNGESITLTGLAVTDIEIYKNGSVTQRASDAGYALLDTDGIDFDGITGIHGFSVDLSDNTDAGFYAVGSWYWVVVSAVTVDSQTVNFIAAVFRIGPAESVAGYPKADVSHFGGTAGTFASGRPEVNTTHFGGSALTQSGGRPEVNTSHVAGTAQTAGDIIADTNDIQSRLPASLVGGRMDSSVGSIIGDTGVAQNFSNVFDDSSAGGGTIHAAEIDSIQSDTNDIQSRLPAALVGGRIDANVGAISGDATAADNLEAAADGTGYNLGNGSIVAASVTGAVGSVAADGITSSSLAASAGSEIAAAVWAEATRTLTAIDEDSTTLDLDATIRAAVGLASANLDTQLAAIDDAVDTEVAAIKAVTDKLDNTLTLTSDGYVFNSVALQAVWDEPLTGHLVAGTTGAALNTASTTAEKLDNTLTNTSDGYVFSGVALQAVWDEPIVGHLTSGTTGAALNAAGSAGDPWSTSLPGAYGAGTAGYIIGNNLDATVSSRASQTSVNTIDDFLDTEVAAIKAVTDKLDTTLFATSDGYAFTANSLEFAPTGGLDAAGVRAAVGLASANLDTQLSAIDAVTDKINTTLEATSDGYAFTANALENVPLDGVRSVIGLASANLDTQLSGIQSDTNDIQTRIPAALVSGRMDASVGAMQANTLTASALASDAVVEMQSGLSTLDAAGVRSAVGLASANLDTQLDAIPTATENADALLNRDMSAVSDTNARSPLNALRFIRNKWSIAGSTLTVTKEDDSTQAWTAAVSTQAGADPVIGNDPA